jgi:DNA-binding winged helix-turn-helix (wHTH) protein
VKYQFDDFVLDSEHFELSHNEKRLHCEPLVIELLGLLVSNHERMVSKEEINQAIWHGRIVSESALSSRIKMLRQLLGNDGGTQRRCTNGVFILSPRLALLAIQRKLAPHL